MEIAFHTLQPITSYVDDMDHCLASGKIDRASLTSHENKTQCDEATEDEDDTSCQISIQVDSDEDKYFDASGVEENEAEKMNGSNTDSSSSSKDLRRKLISRPSLSYDFPWYLEKSRSAKGLEALMKEQASATKEDGIVSPKAIDRESKQYAAFISYRPTALAGIDYFFRRYFKQVCSASLATNVLVKGSTKRGHHTSSSHGNVSE